MGSRESTSGGTRCFAQTGASPVAWECAGIGECFASRIGIGCRARILRYEHFLPGGGILDIHGDAEVMGLKEAVANAEKKVIRAALVATQGRKIKAAEMLGISRKVLWQKMKELGLEEDRGTST